MRNLHELAFPSLQTDLWDRMEFINIDEPDEDARYASQFRARVEALGFHDGTQVREVVQKLKEMQEMHQRLAHNITFLMFQIGADEEIESFLETGRIGR